MLTSQTWEKLNKLKFFNQNKDNFDLFSNIVDSFDSIVNQLLGNISHNQIENFNSLSNRISNRISDLLNCLPQQPDSLSNSEILLNKYSGSEK
jgi:benzoyl-CoA reductase/2-hydroxyglutaryl-CoA dehydratase subunit BcrC/BadD/HgdB